MPNLSKLEKAVTLSGDGEAPKGAFGHDERLRPKEVVAGLRVGAEEKAFPFSQLRMARVVNDRVGGVPVLVVHQPSSDTTTAFEACAKGKVLQFQAADADAGFLVDLETHSSWNAYGLCLEGPLKGTQLRTLILMPEFWFAWSEFHPLTKVFMANDTQRPAAITTKILMQEPLGDPALSKISLFILNVRGGLIATAHTHPGTVFAYILQGDIENQVEPDPPKVYHPGDFFQEPPMHVHQLLRNLSQTEPSKILIFQNIGENAGALPPGSNPLLQESLANITNQQVSMSTLVAPPGASAGVHQHTGPVFAYVLKGEIQSQVDPEQPKVYRAGDVFYEPPMHAHRAFRNLSKTEPAELLIFQVSEKGKALAMGANQ